MKKPGKGIILRIVVRALIYIVIYCILTDLYANCDQIRKRLHPDSDQRFSRLHVTAQATLCPQRELKADVSKYQLIISYGLSHESALE